MCLLWHIKIRDVTRYLIEASEPVMNNQTAVTPYNEETNKKKVSKQQQPQMHVVKIDIQYLVLQRKST